MSSKRKTIFNLVFLVVVFVLTIHFVFRGEDIGDILQAVRDADWRYLLLGLVCVILFILGESTIIFYMMRTLGAKVKMGHCALYSFVGFFFSCITPSASGGQPMQIYFMKKDKMPVPVTTLVLMIVTITYKAVLVLIGVVAAIFGSGFLRGYLGDYMWVFYLGLGLNIFCVTLMLTSGICSWSCKMADGKGTEASGACKVPEEKGKPFEKAGRVYGSVPCHCSFLGRP